MKPFIFYPLLLLTCLMSNSCKTTLESVKVIEVKDYGQFFDPERKSIFTLGNTSTIAFKGDNRLYITASVALTLENVLGSNGEKVGEKVVKQDTSFTVHVAENEAKFGLSYHFDKFGNERGVLFNVDSLLKGIGIDEKNMLLLDMELGSPDKVSKENGVVLERFTFVKKKQSDPDSVYRFYDHRLRNVEFSFSKRLDQQSKSKLVKTLFIYKPTYSSDGQKEYKIKRRVMETSMARDRKQSIDYLNRIFKKFGEDKKAFPELAL